MKSTIHLGAEAFMNALATTSKIAQHSLYVQAMTFEGDTAGQQLIDLMIASPAKDKRLLIDSFSKVVVSDHFVFSLEYLKNADLRKEIANGRTLVQQAQAAGIQVQFTNPTGWFMSQYPLRNHKKMVIIDEQVSYLGGVNFSEHNFAWHDMMIEQHDHALAQCLAMDFLKTWSGENQSAHFRLSQSDLYFFSGIRSKTLYEDFFDHIRNAKSSVIVISPYVSEPLFSILKQASERGVKVLIISPENNNKSIFKEFVESEAAKGYFELRYQPGMSHLKAIVVDEKKLLFGSSNYDLVSYYFEQEVVMVSTDSALVSLFINEVIQPTMQDSIQQEVVSNERSLVPMIMRSLNFFCKYSSQTILKPY